MSGEDNERGSEVDAGRFDQEVMNSFQRQAGSAEMSSVLLKMVKETLRERDTKHGRRVRSHSRSRSASPKRKSCSVSRSRSRSPRRRSKSNRKEKQRRVELKESYSPVNYKEAPVNFSTNRPQLVFNEKILVAVHKIGQVIPSSCSEGFKILADLEDDIKDRQDDILIADRYGTNVANMVNQSTALPISKKKQSAVAQVAKFFGQPTHVARTNEPVVQQPFREMRGGQPRNFQSYPKYQHQGPFAAGGSFANSICNACGQPGHWARFCTNKRGQNAFRPGGVATAPQPLFDFKAGTSTQW